ncbi:chromate transport protein ChrA [Gottschalkia purinilytica]|uniref:Chromate transport protein ChrA n=1 Tax=Gottschalkia purinilytica TaxID=1503 RepID=A0A0L0WE27_GOTPU|nr:chromate transporter [Gottschalkia purinilytica]KNF09733.1 chromate transport protein ChrA [Gottschalkia purinilytica]
MKLFRMFITFFKIGIFTIGGGYAMLPLIQKEVVEENKWLTNEEFLDALAISQSSPGAVSINCSIFIGYRVNGIIGAIVCTLGTSLPSLISILAVSIFLFKYRKLEIINKVFLGIRPAVFAMIAASVYTLGKSLKLGREGKILGVAGFIALVVFNINPIIVLILGAISSIVYYRTKVKGEE